MKVVILAGGLGTRLSEYTEQLPKPMVTIGGKPIIWHIMQIYSNFGYNDFIIALGYKSEKIKEFFLNFHFLNSDFSIDLSTGKVECLKKEDINWKITLVDTGMKTMTGGRVKRLKKFLKNQTFMLTYGDGVGNIDINKLVSFHKKHGKLMTLSAVKPTARFGDLEFRGDIVSSFREKPQMHEGWVNGGFFVCEPGILDFIENDEQMLEREPIEGLVKQEELMAYKHQGFWHSMDTKRDRELLENLFAIGAPWYNYENK